MNGKYDLQISDCSAELNKIKQWIDQNKMHSNIQYLVSYAVIKSSGTIETVMKQMFFNPSTGQIEKLLSGINPVWKVSFETAIKATCQKGQLNSLVELRNSFAHGTAITASIDNIITYLNAGYWILEQLHKIIF
jgi:hypothetical protein